MRALAHDIHVAPAATISLDSASVLVIFLPMSSPLCFLLIPYRVWLSGSMKDEKWAIQVKWDFIYTPPFYV